MYLIISIFECKLAFQRNRKAAGSKNYLHLYQVVLFFVNRYKILKLHGEIHLRSNQKYIFSYSESRKYIESSRCRI